MREFVKEDAVYKRERLVTCRFYRMCSRRCGGGLIGAVSRGCLRHHSLSGIYNAGRVARVGLIYVTMVLVTFAGI